MRLRRLGALAGAFLLTFGVVSSVFADAANPESVDADVSGMTVTLSGDWSWATRGDSCTDRWVGWAVDWDDPNAAGNPVLVKKENKGDPDVFLHVGTPTDNAVHTNENCGSIGAGDYPVGTWGEISHTYSEPGEYHVCVVTYDIHLKDGAPKDASELVAGGAGNNGDNSAETNGKGPGAETGVCAPATIVVEELEPGISIVKTANPTQITAGAAVTYKYVVTNTGDIALSNIEIVDDNGTPGDTSDDFDTDDVDGIDCPKTSLAPDESMECTVVVTGTQVTTTNWATATGEYDEGKTVEAKDFATVTVGAGSVAAETDTPTAPPSDTFSSTTTDAGGALPLLLLILGVIGVGAVVLTPRRARR